MSFKEIPLVYIGFCGIVGATLRDTFSINQFFFGIVENVYFQYKIKIKRHL